MKKKWIAIAAVLMLLTACSRGTETGAGSVIPDIKSEPASESSQAGIKEMTAAAVPEKEEKEVPSAGYTRPVPLDVEISMEYLSEWDAGTELLHAECQKLTVLAAGHDAVNQVLENRFLTAWADIQAQYEPVLADLKARREENPETTDGYWIEQSVVPIRADDKIVSFLETSSSYTGGAHAMYGETGVNLRPEDGTPISLKDVTSDYEQVCGLVKQELRVKYGNGEMFDNYEAALDAMFHEDGSIDNCWVMDMEGLHFVFSPYLLSPYSSGVLSADIFFSDAPGLFLEEYVPAGGFARRMHPDEPEAFDVDGDGLMEQILFDVSYDNETYSSRITISSGGSEAESEAYGSCRDAYLMHTEDGRTYLYLEFAGDNDYRTVTVFDLNGKTPLYVGETANCFLDHLVSDPEDFSLYTHMNVLGTYTGRRRYHVGEDGMPVEKDGVYTVGAEWGRGYELTAKIPVPVWVSQGETGEEKVREMLPAGSRMTVRRTDGKTFVEMELEDGRRCDVQIEKGDYLSTIEGVGEEEYFDGLHYAG